MSGSTTPVFMDSFDDGATASKYNSIIGNTSVAGRTGNALRLANNTATTTNKADWLLPNNTSTGSLAVGFAFNPAVGTAWRNYGLISFVNASLGLETSLIPISGGAFELRYGGLTGTLINTSMGGLWTAGQWQHVELFVLKSTGTTGAYALAVNGRVVMSATGVRTASTNNYYGFGLGVENASSTTGILYDDLYAYTGYTYGSDANTPDPLGNFAYGDCVITFHLPNGNGSQIGGGWNGSDGNATDNYLLVDEATPSSTDYVDGTVAANEDYYEMADLVATDGTIRAVGAQYYAAASAVGSSSFQPALRRSGNAYASYGATFSNLSTSYKVLQSCFKFAPQEASSGPSIPWDITHVNAVTVGVVAV